MGVPYQPADISVLLVEDELLNSKAHTDILQREGLIVDAVETPAEGIRRVEERFPHKPYDSVLTDLSGIPSGVDLVREVRTYDETLPCYIITGGSPIPGLEDKAKALAEEDPHTELIYKPVTLSIISEIALAIIARTQS